MANAPRKYATKHTALLAEVTRRICATLADAYLVAAAKQPRPRGVQLWALHVASAAKQTTRCAWQSNVQCTPEPHSGTVASAFSRRPKRALWHAQCGTWLHSRGVAASTHIRHSQSTVQWNTLRNPRAISADRCDRREARPALGAERVAPTGRRLAMAIRTGSALGLIGIRT